MAYQPVVFNEGAPLDPSKLMELQANITGIVADVGSLKNQTETSTYTVLTDAGTYMTEALVAGTPHELDVPYSASFSKAPRVIASIGSSIGSGEIVTVSVKDGDTKPKIQVWTNKARGPVRVNWMAFEKK